MPKKKSLRSSDDGVDGYITQLLYKSISTTPQKYLNSPTKVFPTALQRYLKSDLMHLL